MVFSSPIFIFYFLPLALLCYYLVSGGSRLTILAAFSYLFYGWVNPWFVPLILWMTVVDFTTGNLIGGHWRLFGAASQRQRRFFLAVSLCNSLGMLFLFKYFAFAQANINAIAHWLGHPGVRIISIALPAGISFYTFESISYVVDIYLGRARPASEWTTAINGRGWRAELSALRAFACYLVQFPHLVAGPIVRYQDLEPQLHRVQTTTEDFARGAFFFALGLAKKVLIADIIGAAADASFGAAHRSTADAWVGLFAYAFQIYFDFSGYSDMAIGLGLMFGFKFLRNFDSPYNATSVTDFWRRWHISLSTWLRDYLYIPLGGNRRGAMRTYANLIVVMLLGGLWHGASWKFVLWGGMHGAGLALERLGRATGTLLPLPRAIRTALTFFFICAAWVPFRSYNLNEATTYFADLVGLGATSISTALSDQLRGIELWSALVLAAAIAFLAPQTWTLSERLTWPRILMALLFFAAALVYVNATSYHPFLYFEF